MRDDAGEPNAAENLSPGVTQSARAGAPGSVVAWGYNFFGELGDGTTVDRTSPVAVSGLGLASRIVTVAVGGWHSMALKSDGSAWAWGYNASGSLGDGTTTDSSVPVAVSDMGLGSGAVAVAAGAQHSLALKSDGSVWAWGYNGNGALGDGTITERHTPVAVTGLGPGSGVVAVAGGAWHSLALKSDGSVLAWGNNADGELGDGSAPIERHTPVAVSGLGPGSGVVAVAGGDQHSLALKSDGSILACGNNSFGQLGDATTTERKIPVAVNGLGPGSGVVAVAAGVVHSLALKSDGSVWAWGRNTYGALGDGTTTDSSIPVAVSGMGPGSGVVAVAAGGSFSLALKSDGSVWAWGYNAYGELGDGMIVNSSIPVAVSGLGPGSGVVTLAVGILHSLAMFDSNPLVSIAVTPANSSLPEGFNATFQATGTYTDGGTKDLTSICTWTSSTPAVATITDAGLVSAISPGTTMISATLGSVVGATGLTVAALVSIAVTPANSSLGEALNARFAAIGTYTDGSIRDLTVLCTWASSSPKVATVSGAGLAHALIPGTTTIIATLGSVAGSTGLTVAALVSIAVTPANSRLAQGLNAQFNATGTYSDGSTANVTPTSTWISTNPAVASISSTALAQAVSPGTTRISATQGSVFGSTGLTVYLARIAFTSTRPGNPQIYVMNPDGSGALRLTNNHGIDTTPSWSPGQMKIAFSATTGSPVGPIGQPQIITMNADGTVVTQLTNAGQNTTPAWSPDGSRIAFTSTRDGNPQIYVMKPDGSGQLRLTKNGGIDTTPSWSPDGKRIAFCGATASPTGPIGIPQILTMMANGTVVIPLTRIGQNTNPAWSPDGSKIAFASTRDGNPEIYIMNPNGTGQLRLTKTPGIDTTPSWSPDGKKIVFSSDHAGTPQIFTMNADGSGMKELTTSVSGHNTTPAWGSH